MSREEIRNLLCELQDDLQRDGASIARYGIDALIRHIEAENWKKELKAAHAVARRVVFTLETAMLKLSIEHKRAT